MPHVALPDLVPGHWPAFISVPAVDSSGSDSLVFLYRALRMLDVGWTSLILALESPSWTSSAVFTFRVPSVVIRRSLTDLSVADSDQEAITCFGGTWLALITIMDGYPALLVRHFPTYPDTLGMKP